ncbi:MAG TPA: hypothetical protein VGE21_10935 [Flavobacteriales bacterium]
MIALRLLLPALALPIASLLPAQVDTLALIESIQQRMDRVDDQRGMGPAAIWAKLPGKPEPVKLAPDKDPGQVDLLYLFYKDPDGSISGVSTIRYLQPDSTSDGSTHYFDPGGRTVAVRWELSTPSSGCTKGHAIAAKEKYYAEDGGLLEEWDWLTDEFGNDLEPEKCKVVEPAGRSAFAKDRATLLGNARIPQP